MATTLVSPSAPADDADAAAASAPAAPPVVPSRYVRGTEGADTFNVSAGPADTRLLVAGVGGDDTIRGGAAGDALNGGAGRDALFGNGGDDTITGGAGADRMAGGGGEDKFVFLAGDFGRARFGAGAVDTILDFGGAGARGGDFLEFRGLGDGARLDFVREVGGGGGSRQLYAVTYDTNGDAPGGVQSFELQVDMAGGSTARLTAADYGFFPIYP